MSALGAAGVFGDKFYSHLMVTLLRRQQCFAAVTFDGNNSRQKLFLVLRPLKFLNHVRHSYKWAFKLKPFAGYNFL